MKGREGRERGERERAKEEREERERKMGKGGAEICTYKIVALSMILYVRYCESGIFVIALDIFDLVCIISAKVSLAPNSFHFGCPRLFHLARANDR